VAQNCTVVDCRVFDGIPIPVGGPGICVCVCVCVIRVCLVGDTKQENATERDSTDGTRRDEMKVCTIDCFYFIRTVQYSTGSNVGEYSVLLPN
jgi:hypothetical protein